MSKKEKFNIYDMFFNKTALRDADSMADKPKNIKNFFPMLWQNFSRIFYSNILFVIGNFPIFFLILAASGLVSERGLSPQSTMFGNYFGALNFIGNNPVSSALGTVHGVQVEVNVPGDTTRLFIYLALLLFLTFGYINAGISLSMREIMKGEPVYFFDNMKNAVKNNPFSALILGIIDLAVLLLAGYDVVFFYINAGVGGFVMSMFFGISVVVALIYLSMRMYIYPMLVTFKLSIWKIIKNSLIFAIVGLKRNIPALMMIALSIGVNYFVLNLYMPIGIILPFILTIGIIEFTMTYTAWPKIKEIMIDPYYNEDGSEKKES